MNLHTAAETSVTSEDVLDVLASAEKPVNVTEIRQEIKRRSAKKFPRTFRGLLDAEVRSGKAFRWGTDRYWSRSPQALSRERLLRLSALEVLANDPLCKRVAAEGPRISLTVVRSVRRELLREKLLREVAPPKGSRSKAKFQVNTEHPEPYLEREILQLLEEFGRKRSEEEVRALLAPAEAGPRPEPPPPEPDGPQVHEVAEAMFSAMKRLELAPYTTVTFYSLRHQPELAQIPKEIFDRAALKLQDDRRALLAQHDHAPRLPESERAELVTDNLGTYYVSIYERRP